ncbi:MAG: tetratricopeptide repeat protein [Pseudomonadota bacterium]
MGLIFLLSVDVSAASSLEDFFAKPQIPRQEIVATANNLPAWVTIWQDARRHALAGDFFAARSAYSRFLEIKGDVAEARWEFAALLLSANEFDQAAGLLEMLLETDPDRVEYLNGLGYVMQKKGHFDRAVELFDRAAGRDPANIIALTGLSEGLLALGNLGRALPRLEDLNERQVDDINLQKRLVCLYLDLHLAAKARPLAVRLAERADAALDDLKCAARAHEETGLKDVAAKYWRKAVALSPGDSSGHEWLAAYLYDEGSWKEALPHLLFLLDRDSRNGDLLTRVAACFLKLKEPAKAASYYEKYIALFPHDKDIIRQLVTIYAGLGKESETLSALDRYFVIESDPSPGNLRQAAQLYDAAGRYHDAIPLYRRLLEINPDDSDVLETLARDLLAIGEDDGTLTIWAHLARISPDSKAIYRSMMELLIQLDRKEELVHVLEEINKLDPNDVEVALRLSSALLAGGDVKRAEAVFLPVAANEIVDLSLLTMRAEIFEDLRMPDHALKDYMAIRAMGDVTPELQLKCLEISASIGKMKLASRYLTDFLSKKPGDEEILRVANGFRNGKDYATAHSLYQELLDRCADPEFRSRILFQFALSYEHQDLYFEAEQVLRIALLENPEKADILVRLFDLHFFSGNKDEASVWLAQLDRIARSSAAKGDGWNSAHWLLELSQARLLNANGKFSAAQRKIRALQKDMAIRESGDEITYQDKSLHYLAGLELAKSLLGLGEYDEAEKQCRFLEEQDVDALDCLVLLQQIYTARGDGASADELHRKALAEAGLDLGRMFRLTDVYRQAGVKRAMVSSADAATAMAQDSFTALFRQAQAHVLAGDLPRSHDMIEHLGNSYPGNTAVEALRARVAFTLGLDDEALDYCEAILSRQPYRADIQLLKARIYWRQLDWEESFNVYENYLIPPVLDLVSEQSMSVGVDLPDEEKISVWQRLTFSGPKKDRFIDSVMSPAFVMEEGNAEMKKIAASLYSRYKWQQRFALELAARRFVEQRDDFQAINQFLQLVEKFPEDESLLFDLAGVYSRLGRLGDEALLYERLTVKDPNYPGLEEALERNRLKRLPRVIAGYRYQTEDGRDGYKSIRKNAVDIGSWVSLQPGSDLDMTLSRISYSSSDADNTVRANRAFASYEANILDRFDVSLGGGMESLDGQYADTALFECGIRGKVSDRVQGEVRYERDVVEDTVASLSRNVVSENVQAGLFLGLFPRVLTGGDYEYTNYSDGNNMKGYSFWASYILFPEPTYLQFKFSYDFRDMRESGSALGTMLDDGFTDDDHPYWTPRNYWKNGYAVLWKHKLSADTLERGTPSYYSGEYLVEYDSNGHMIQSLRGLFFLELSSSWMLQSAARLVVSDEYRAKDLTVSAIYRW